MTPARDPKQKTSYNSWPTTSEKAKKRKFKINLLFLGISGRKPVFRGPPIELHRLGYSGPIFKTCSFFRFSSRRTKTNKNMPKRLPVSVPLEKTAPRTLPKSKSARLEGPQPNRELCTTKWHPNYASFTFRPNSTFVRNMQN